MAEVFDLIKQHGDIFYLITFLWTALEGETFVIFAALAAQQHLLNIGLLFIAAWLGSFAGDQVYFLIGRHAGTWILKKSPRIQPKLDKVFGWLEGNDVLFILTYRFMYGIRNISSVAIGMSKLTWRRFLILNFIAAGLWSVAFCGVGYFFGDVISRLGRNKEAAVEHSVTYELTFGVLGLFILVVGFRWLVGRWRKRNQM